MSRASIRNYSDACLTNVPATHPPNGTSRSASDAILIRATSPASLVVYSSIRADRPLALLGIDPLVLGSESSLYFCASIDIQPKADAFVFLEVTGNGAYSYTSSVTEPRLMVQKGGN